MVAFLHLHFAGDKLGHKRIWPCIWPVMELVLETQSSDYKLPSRRYTLPSHECCHLKGGEGQFQGAVGGSRRLRPDCGLLRQTETPRAQGPQRHLFILFLKLHHKQKEIQDCNTSSLQNDSETLARSQFPALGPAGVVSALVTKFTSKVLVFRGQWAAIRRKGQSSDKVLALITEQPENDESPLIRADFRELYQDA